MGTPSSALPVLSYLGTHHHHSQPCIPTRNLLGSAFKMGWRAGVYSNPQEPSKLQPSRTIQRDGFLGCCPRISYPASEWEFLPPSKSMSVQTWDSGRCPCPWNKRSFKVSSSPNHSGIVTLQRHSSACSRAPEHCSHSPHRLLLEPPDPCRPPPPPPRRWARSIYFHSKPVLRVAGGDMQGRHCWRGGL